MPEPEAERPRFLSPHIQDNPHSWGPTGVPEKFEKLPFQSFSKGDRLGRVADFTGTMYQDRRYGNRYMNQFTATGGQINSQYAYYHDEEDATFQLVDSSRIQRTAQQKARNLKQLQQQRRLIAVRERERRMQATVPVVGGGSRAQRIRDKDRQRALRRLQKQFGGRQRYDGHRTQQQKQRQPSVQIKPDWEVLEEIDFPRLQKLNYPAVTNAQDLEQYGSLEYYDKSYDRVTTKLERPLIRVNRNYHSVPTTDDPVIQKLAKKSGDYHVFASDDILATLMCCTRSVASWDIYVYRIGNKLFLDKRENSVLDWLTVSETALDPPIDDDRSINSPKNLAMEATFINRNFCQQVLKQGEERFNFSKQNPFAEAEGWSPEETPSVVYKYRSWDLGDGIKLVGRCEQDGVMIGPNAEPQFLTIKAFNEWDSRFSGGVDWRSKIDNQRGAVLATELRNNSNKLAKWTVQALLAGSDYIKFGYVSRVNVRDSTKHVILGTQQFKPHELASQITLQMDNAWGVLKCLIDMCLKLPTPGKYLIMKDPNKSVIRLYRIPQFEDDDDDDEEDDEVEASKAD